MPEPAGLTREALAERAADAAPIKGIVYLPPSALRVASIVLRNPRQQEARRRVDP